VNNLIFGLELAYELDIEFVECWDFSRENKHCNFILIFQINTNKIVGFWVVAFPGYLLCYVPLILFLYWLLFVLCLWASIVKSRSRFLLLVFSRLHELVNLYVFLHGIGERLFFGLRVCREFLRIYVQNFQKQIVDLDSLGKNTQIQKTNWLN